MVRILARVSEGACFAVRGREALANVELVNQPSRDRGCLPGVCSRCPGQLRHTKKETTDVIRSRRAQPVAWRRFLPQFKFRKASEDADPMGLAVALWGFLRRSHLRTRHNREPPGDRDGPERWHGLGSESHGNKYGNGLAAFGHE